MSVDMDKVGVVAAYDAINTDYVHVNEHDITILVI